MHMIFFHVHVVCHNTYFKSEILEVLLKLLFTVRINGSLMHRMKRFESISNGNINCISNYNL